MGSIWGTSEEFVLIVDVLAGGNIGKYNDVSDRVRAKLQLLWGYSRSAALTIKSGPTKEHGVAEAH